MRPYRFVAVAFLVAVSAVQVRADAVPLISPTKNGPYKPKPTLNENPRVCESILEEVERQYYSTNYAINILNPIGPMRRVTWLFPKTDGRSFLPITYEQGSNKIVAMDGTTTPSSFGFVIAWSQWNHSWRGQNHKLTIYPNVEEFKKHLIAAIDTSSSASLTGGVEILSGWWYSPAVFYSNESVFLISGYGDFITQRVQSLHVHQVLKTGLGPEICEIELEPQNSLDLGPTSLSDLYSVLSEIQGGECAGGTLMPMARLRSYVRTTPSRVLLRPWVETGFVRPPAEHITDWLRFWSVQELSYYRKYRQLIQLLPQVESDLAKYYQRRFGVQTKVAIEAAKERIDWIYRAHFVFPSGYTPSVEGAFDVLRKAVIEGSPASEVDGLITAYFEEQDEQMRDLPVSDSLEHTNLLTLLLSRGGSPNATNVFGKTPLMYAAHFDLLDAARILIASSAEVNARTDAQDYQCPVQVNVGDRTALAYAMENASVELIDLLIDNGADLSAIDTAKRSLKHYLSVNTQITDADRLRLTGLIDTALAEN